MGGWVAAGQCSVGVDGSGDWPLLCKRRCPLGVRANQRWVGGRQGVSVVLKWTAVPMLLGVVSAAGLQVFLTSAPTRGGWTRAWSRAL